jgi:uncharacterized protein YkwD
MARTTRILTDAALVATGVVLLSSVGDQGGQVQSGTAAAQQASTAGASTKPRSAIGDAVAASVAVAVPVPDEGLPEPGVVTESACEGFDADPGDDGYRDAVRCLLNRERRAYHLRGLRLSGPLSRAAQAHSRDMVARRYFSHDTLNGGDFSSRIMRSGFAPRGNGYNVGENIAWGAGSDGTPQALVNDWMDSPGHRANILKGTYRSIGIGVGRGAPERGDFGNAVTLTTNFG